MLNVFRVVSSVPSQKHRLVFTKKALAISHGLLDPFKSL